MNQPGDEKPQATLPERAVPTSAAEVRNLLAGLEGQLENEKGLRAWLRSRPTSVRFALVLGVTGARSALEIVRSQQVAEVLLGVGWVLGWLLWRRMSQTTSARPEGEWG